MALNDFSTVLGMDSAYAPAYNGRGLVWDRMLKFEDAIVDFSMAVKLDAQNAIYWHNRACCYRNFER
jgi:tetratricopeptide (TPR) repeat protein